MTRADAIDLIVGALAANAGREATTIYVELAGLSRPIYDALRGGEPESPFRPYRGARRDPDNKWHCLVDYGDGVSLSLWTAEAAKPSPRRLREAAS